MPPRRFNAGPKLPAALRDEIAERERADGRRPRTQLNRKEARKEQRQAKKERKAEHFSHHHSPSQPRNANGLKRAAAEAPIESTHKKRKLNDGQANVPAKKAVRFAKDESEDRPSKGGKTALEKMAERLDKRKAPSVPASTTSSFPKTQAEIEEDARIARYEKLLAQGEGSDEEDGLDDLISFADKIAFSSLSKSDLVESSEGDEESAGENTEDDDDMDEEEQEEYVINAEEDDSDEDDSEEDSEEEDSEGQYDSEEFHGFGDENEPSEPADASPAKPVSEAPQLPRTAGAYVPPHLRAKQAAAGSNTVTPEQAKLKRQAQGLLNRLSEQNIASILSEIETLYRNFSRNDVTTTLTNLVLETISSRSNLLDSFVILYAALIASLTKIIGIEFGASFVHELVTSYKKHLSVLKAAPPSDSGEEERGKECTNLIVLLSELYNFQVISSVLLYDVIRDLLEGDLAEFNVELLLKLLKNSGPQLRHDDPKALDDIVKIVQQKTATSSQTLGSRTKFMLETLANLKSSKSKAVQNQAVAAEATTRMKKFLGGLSKTHTIRSHESLRVTLADLLSSDQKGKWWLVGAAWAGDPLVDRQVEVAEEKASAASESAILKLAKKQGMNTDVRRKIFVALMTSEDYVNARERLDQLHLSEVQQREIIRVLLHCCGTEKVYNPFYALVAQELCKASHSHKVTLQFCLWDFLRELGETEVGGAEIVKSASAREDVVEFDVSTNKSRMENLAKAFAWLVAKGASNLMIFRPVNFTALQPRTIKFFQTFLVYMILDTQLRAPIIDISEKIALPKKRNEEALEQVVIKAASNGGLAKGLIYFIRKLPPPTEEYPTAVADTIEWGLEVIRDTLKTGMDLAATLS